MCRYASFNRSLTRQSSFAPRGSSGFNAFSATPKQDLPSLAPQHFADEKTVVKS